VRKGPSFFDVRVFNPSASSYRNTAVASLYRQFERENREDTNKEFERLIIPLVFSTFGGMGGAATTMYKRLASLLSAKRD